MTLDIARIEQAAGAPENFFEGLKAARLLDADAPVSQVGPWLVALRELRHGAPETQVVRELHRSLKL